MNKFLSFPNNKHGFSLIEVMIAVLLLGLALAPAIDLFSKSGRISVSSWNETTALNLALSKLEEIKDKPFESVTDQNGTFSDNPDYQYQVTTTTAAAEPYPSYLITVSVTVSYSETGGAKSISITMEKCKR